MFIIPLERVFFNIMSISSSNHVSGKEVAVTSVVVATSIVVVATSSAIIFALV